MINKYKINKDNLYILFADIEKCFDNLWLKDCILEIIRSGTPIHEANYIYQMNKNVKVKVKTPVGLTEEIEFEEIVTQGTVGRNKLCGASTDGINKMGRFNLEAEKIKYPIFVDDMVAMGNKNKK